MKYSAKWTALLLSAVVLLGALSACGVKNSDADSGGGSQVQTISSLSSSNEANPRTPAALDLTDATVITLSGGSASVEGSGAEAEGGTVTITAAGVYAVSGTLDDGRIIVNAPGEDVTVALNGADITCSYGSPLYIYRAGTATVHLMEGTANALTDGASYTFADGYSSEEDEEPNACLYSKADLVIEGAGSLTVTAHYNNGITGKDTLQVYDGVISVSAVNHGVNGKDSNTIDSAALTVACGGDAIRSTNDSDDTLGWVSVSNSTLVLDAGEDGIQAETAVTLSSGSYTVTSGGGSGVEPSDDASAKGIKSGTALTLASGVYTMDCSDDAFHSNGDVTVSGGVYTVSTGDDAFHADEALTVSDGVIGILTSYEGLEGSTVTVSGGVISIAASDDGVNAAGGADSSGFGGFGPGNTFGSANSDYYIDISGGYMVIEAGGDGLDSNGNTAMSGGTVIVSSTGRGDGALDYEGSFTLTGGTLLAFDTGAMSESPSEASQCTVFVGFGTTLSKGTYVSLENEAQSFVFQLPVDAATMLFSSPDLESGAAYTVSHGGSYDGASADGICSGGAYSGGTVLAELTLSDGITTYGNAGMGGRGSGQTGGRGDRMPPDGEPSGGGTVPELPADGTAPEAAPDGEAPGDRAAPDGNGGPGGGHKGMDGKDGRAGEDGTMGEPPSGGSLSDAG